MSPESYLRKNGGSRRGLDRTYLGSLLGGVQCTGGDLLEGGPSLRSALTPSVLDLNLRIQPSTFNPTDDSL